MTVYAVKVFEGNSMLEITYNCESQHFVSASRSMDEESFIFLQGIHIFLFFSFLVWRKERNMKKTYKISTPKSWLRFFACFMFYVEARSVNGEHLSMKEKELAAFFAQNLAFYNENNGVLLSQVLCMIGSLGNLMFKVHESPRMGTERLKRKALSTHV